MNQVTGRIVIPPTVHNLSVVAGVAAEDSELQVAMERDAAAVATHHRLFSAHFSAPSARVITVGPKSSSASDNKGKQKHTYSMNDITRHELDAKLEAIEARMDGRVASIEGKIDAFLAAQAVRDSAQTERNQGFDKAIGEIKTGISSMKTTVIVTAISAALAIVFGIVTFNATLSSNMLAAFQAGKSEVITRPVSAPPSSPAPTPPPSEK